MFYRDLLSEGISGLDVPVSEGISGLELSVLEGIGVSIVFCDVPAPLSY